MNRKPATRRASVLAPISVVATVSSLLVTATAATAKSTTVSATDSSLHQQWAFAPYGGAGKYVGMARNRDLSETLKITAVNDGTTVDLYGVLGHDGGVADLYVDGAKLDTPLSFFAPMGDPADGARQNVLSSPVTLSAGKHTLRLVVLGQQAPGSTASWVRIDSWDVTDGGVLTSYEEASHDTTGKVKDAFASYVATDATAGRIAVASHVSIIGVTPPKVWVAVKGRNVTFRLCKGPTGGRATVAVDAATQTVGLYQRYTSCGAVAVATGSAGTHIVSVSVDGRIPSGSTGTRVGFDAFVVR